MQYNQISSEEQLQMIDAAIHDLERQHFAAALAHVANASAPRLEQLEAGITCLLAFKVVFEEQHGIRTS